MEIAGGGGGGVAINVLVQKLCREEEVGFVGKFCREG